MIIINISRKNNSKSLISILIIMILLFFGYWIFTKVQSQHQDNNIIIDESVSENIKNFVNHEINNNKVLLVEFNTYHHECMPGFAKYYTELGYDVDILILKDFTNSFDYFEPKNKINIFEIESKEQFENYARLLSKKIKKYKHIFANTLYGSELEKNLGLLDLSQIIYVMHDTDLIKNNNNLKRIESEDKLVYLANIVENRQVNPHYFGDFNVKHKNSRTNFMVIGNMNPAYRNYDLLMNSIRELKNKNKDFVVTVIGYNTDINMIPEDIRDKFDIKGYLNYREMYDEVIKSDFILMLLDSNIEAHLKYKTIKSSGNVQLSYGFNTPVIISNDFAEFYKFDKNNSIIYENNNLLESLERAINCSDSDYINLQNNLKITAKNIFNNSLNNLKNLIK
ncbi:MAG: hypothetical protein J6K87_00915 [Clostridia bacterium]|nr:hypothetical protein [Clostridia bacterium]